MWRHPSLIAAASLWPFALILWIVIGMASLVQGGSSWRSPASSTATTLGSSWFHRLRPLAFFCASESRLSSAWWSALSRRCCCWRSDGSRDQVVSYRVHRRCSGRSSSSLAHSSARSPGTRARSSRPTSPSPSIPVSRCTSVTPTAHGSVARTGCSVSTCPRGRTCPRSMPTTSPGSRPASTTDRARPWDS